MNSFTVNLFLVQQNINTILINKLSHISTLSFLTAFIGGIFTSISPCVVSSIPIAVVYLNQKKRKLYHILVLFTGICTSFLGAGIISLFIKQYTWIFLEKIPFLWSIFLIVIGLSVLNIIPTNILLFNTTKFTIKQKNQIHLFDSYLLGIVLGITISPCSTPITITLLAWILSTQNYIEGFYLLFAYTIGYIMPLIVLIISFNNLQTINIMSKKSYIITNMIGCMTLTIGSYSLFKEFLVLL